MVTVSAEEKEKSATGDQPLSSQAEAETTPRGETEPSESRTESPTPAELEPPTPAELQITEEPATQPEAPAGT